ESVALPTELGWQRRVAVRGSAKGESYITSPRPARVSGQSRRRRSGEGRRDRRLLPLRGDGSERVHCRDAGRRDVPDVAGREGEPVDEGGCCEQSIDCGKRALRHEMPPSVGDCGVHWEDALLEGRLDFAEPPLERSCRRRVAPADGLDTPANLAG